MSLVGLEIVSLIVLEIVSLIGLKIIGSQNVLGIIVKSGKIVVLAALGMIRLMRIVGVLPLVAMCSAATSGVRIEDCKQN